MKTDTTERVVVQSMSPDGSVVARLTDEELTVRMDPRALPYHDDVTLAGQCGAAVSRALAGGVRAESLRRKREDDEVDPEHRRRLERFGAELDALDTEGDSGPVTVQLRGRSHAEFALRPRTVNYQGVEQLTRHLNAALTSARQARRTPTFDIYMRVFD